LTCSRAALVPPVFVASSALKADPAPGSFFNRDKHPVELEQRMKEVETHVINTNNSECQNDSDQILGLHSGRVATMAILFDEFNKRRRVHFE
jgi:hypothetical protein